jgi:hypothetical protein
MKQSRKHKQYNAEKNHKMLGIDSMRDLAWSSTYAHPSVKTSYLPAGIDQSLRIFVIRELVVFGLVQKAGRIPLPGSRLSACPKIASSLIHDPLLTSHNTPNAVLHLTEPHHPTSLTFEVVDQAGQADELAPARHLRTVVKLLPVDRRVEMTVQAQQSTKRLSADIALVVKAIESLFRRHGLLVISRSTREPVDHFLGDDARGISPTDSVVEGVASDSGTASARLKVCGKACSRGEGVGAPRTRDIGAAVNARVEVLQQLVNCIECVGEEEADTWRRLFSLSKLRLHWLQ